MVEVFKTNVQEADESRKLVQKLLEHFPKTKINFDLEDCDKILRVEGRKLKPDKIAELITAHGYHCEVLE